MGRVQREPHDAEDGSTDPHDAAWRAIVDNYGDRPELDPDDLPGAGPRHDHAAAGPGDAPEPPAERVGRWRLEPETPVEGPRDPFALTPEDRFVPPEPPPVDRPPLDRLAAWVGVLGAPVVVVALLLLSTVLGVGFPGWVLLLLVAAFIGGFLYLVARMPREPRDPWDDGAQV